MPEASRPDRRLECRLRQCSRTHPDGVSRQRAYVLIALPFGGRVITTFVRVSQSPIP